MMLPFRNMALTGLCLCLLTATSAGAQTAKYVHTSSIPQNEQFYAVEEYGYMDLKVGDEAYLQEYMIRYPEQLDRWNGRLVVGLTGRTVDHLRFWWENMYDLVGRYTVDQGYAFAMINAVDINKSEDAFEVNRRFLTFIKNHIKNKTDRAPDKTYAVGVSNGGAFIRRIAEAIDSPIDGGLIISGGGGHLPGWLERQARIIRHWPDIDPKKHPNLPDTDKRIAAYASVSGTPVEARAQWRFLASQLQIGQLRSRLAEYELTGLSDEDLLQFRIDNHKKNQAFMTSLEKATTTGRLLIPVIEVVGTHDDVVYPEVLTYAGKADRFMKQTEKDVYRLYQIENVWHMGNEFSFWFTKGKAYSGILSQTFAALDQWVTSGTTPPDNQTYSPAEITAYEQQQVERLTQMHPLVLKDLPVTETFDKALEDARAEADRLKSPEIATEHLLLGLMQQEDLAGILRNQGMNLASVQQRVTPGKRRPWDFDFDRFMSLHMTIPTSQPIAGTKEHIGQKVSQTREEIVLSINGEQRIIPVDQIIGNISIGDVNDKNAFKTDGAGYFQYISRNFFGTPWYLTTSQPVEGATKHFIRFNKFLSNRLEGVVNGQMRTIPYDLIGKTEIVDMGDGAVFWFSSGAEYVWNTDLKQIFRVAIEESRLMQKEKVDALHLLHALIRVRKGGAERFLDEYDIQYENVKPVVQ